MFERKDITTHTRAINEIVRKYCEENGLSFEPGNIRYTDAEFAYKCTVRATDEAGNVTLDSCDKWAIASLIEDAPDEVKDAPTVIGRRVHLINGKIAKIIGYNRKRPKYCWTIERDGVTRICGNHMIMWHRGFAA